MHILKRLLSIIFVGAGYFCSAQTFTTPEVFSFKQEVFRPISYYTGQANISIPLTHIQTPEITIPITLDYVGGGGLRAVNPYSSAGMGWRVTAGGAITRTKNGVCDEVIGTSPALTGFFSLTPNLIGNSYVRNSVSSYVTVNSNGTQYFNSNIEYSPDVFSFSFLGYSGYFVMGYDGVFRIQSQDIVSVVKDAVSNWPGSGNTVGFTLTANDGTKFKFGYNKGSMELSGGNGPGIPFQVDAWYITKIEFTNGRIINFNYQDNESSFVRYTPSPNAFSSAASCPVILDNITFNGGRVVCRTSVVTQAITGAISYPRLIDKIELTDNADRVVSTSTFSYSSETSQRYYLLDYVTIDGRKYTFAYHDRTNLPAAGVANGADYWGYYNGQFEVTTMGGPSFVSSYWDTYLNPSLTQLASRAPSLSHAKRGILTSITYPTGGVETYEYELNTYSYVGTQTLGGMYYSFSEEPKVTGGLRIAKITLGNMVRKYKYVNTFDPNNPDYDPQTMSYIGFSSSGALFRLPRVPYFGTEVVNSLSIDGEPPIVYSKVIEFLSDKSYTEYTMRSPVEIPDGDNNQNTNYFSVQCDHPSIFSTLPKVGFVGSLGKGSSRSLERGQVKKIKMYNSANVPKKEITYTYASDPNRYNQFVAAVSMTGTDNPAMSQFALELGLAYFGEGLYFSVINSYEIYTFPVYLEQEVEQNYENGVTLTKTTQYQYNQDRLPSTTTSYNSNGVITKAIVKYPRDINTGDYAAMVNKKMLNFPVEQLQVEGTTITAGKLTTYKANGTSYVPDKNYSMVLTAPAPESGFTYFNGTTKDPLYATAADISYDSYSTYGNVRQTTAKDGIVTSYLWDALGVYPMAQVKGAAYSSISAEDGKAATYSSGTLFTSLSSLVPTAITNTYSYKPLIGMSTATDARGRTMTYTYDQYNRLALIRDHENNVVKRYCYNYQGQTVNCGFYGNQPVTRTLRKNNCSGCQIGSQVTYSVPANTYYASSQTDANILAQNDLTANTQNYANANGTCSTSVMTSLVSTNLILAKNFTVVFHNNCTGFDYSYTLNANTSNVTISPQLPTGNYNVTFTPVGGGTTNYGYMVNDFYVFGTTGNILGVDIVSGTNQVRVYP